MGTAFLHKTITQMLNKYYGFMMLFILIFSSCTPSLTGNWRGDCVFSDLANNEDLTVFAQIDRDSNHLLRGTLQLTDWNDKKSTERTRSYVKRHDRFSFLLKAKLSWSKNVLEERDAPCLISECSD